MTDSTQQSDGHVAAGRTFEIIVRVVVGLGLLGWCLYILAPFFHAVVWGVLLAVAFFPVFRKGAERMGGRTKTAAVVFAVIGLASVLLPAVLLSASLVGGAQEIAEDFQAGRIDVPPPSPSVAEWPVIGAAVHDLWTKAASDLGLLAEPIAPYLKQAGGWTLSVAGSLGGAILQAIFAILIAAAFLAQADWADRFSRSLATKLVGRRGADLARISTVTVRGVARGILGVALIQSTLAGLGFAVVGIPGAGLWALVCLVLCVVQVPAAVVILPTIIYVFSVEPTLTAVIYTVWAVLVMLSDNVLKPFLFGKEVETPALVLLIGSIGGMLTSGIIGLFTGAVILALGYELLRAWLAGAEARLVGDAPPE